MGIDDFGAEKSAAKDYGVENTTNREGQVFDFIIKTTRIAAPSYSITNLISFRRSRFSKVTDD